MEVSLITGDCSNVGITYTIVRPVFLGVDGYSGIVRSRFENSRDGQFLAWSFYIRKFYDWSF